MSKLYSELNTILMEEFNKHRQYIADATAMAEKFDALLFEAPIGWNDPANPNDTPNWNIAGKDVGQDTVKQGEHTQVSADNAFAPIILYILSNSSKPIRVDEVPAKFASDATLQSEFKAKLRDVVIAAQQSVGAPVPDAETEKKLNTIIDGYTKAKPDEIIKMLKTVTKENWLKYLKDTERWGIVPFNVLRNIDTDSFDDKAFTGLKEALALAITDDPKQQDELLGKSLKDWKNSSVELQAKFEQSQEDLTSILRELNSSPEGKKFLHEFAGRMKKLAPALDNGLAGAEAEVGADIKLLSKEMKKNPRTEKMLKARRIVMANTCVEALLIALNALTKDEKSDKATKSIDDKIAKQRETYTRKRDDAVDEIKTSKKITTMRNLRLAIREALEKIFEFDSDEVEQIEDNVMRGVSTEPISSPRDKMQRVSDFFKRFESMYINKRVQEEYDNITTAAYADLIARTGDRVDQKVYFENVLVNMISGAVRRITAWSRVKVMALQKHLTFATLTANPDAFIATITKVSDENKGSFGSLISPEVMSGAGTFIKNKDNIDWGKTNAAMVAVQKYATTDSIKAKDTQTLKTMGIKANVGAKFGKWLGGKLQKPSGPEAGTPASGNQPTAPTIPKA